MIGEKRAITKIRIVMRGLYNRNIFEKNKMTKKIPWDPLFVVNKDRGNATQAETTEIESLFS